MTSNVPDSRVNAPVTEAESISGTATAAAAITDPAAPSNRIIKPRDFIAFFYLSNENLARAGLFRSRSHQHLAHETWIRLAIRGPKIGQGG